MSVSRPAGYVGRFAPSPTGPLHFGSLLAAVASYLEARVSEGRWLVRIEDIDPPRQQEGATESILEALDTYGFDWDGDVIFQSSSAAAHDAALQRLLDAGHAYYCDCSRRQLADQPSGTLGRIYPGTCRERGLAAGTDLAVRIRTNNRPIGFDDRLQGRQSMAIQSESGDFVIRRRDGLIAYQLAVVVDDALQGVTDIVRGIDLMDSTPRQIWLQQLLQYPTPAYCHIPVAIDSHGDKLSKLTGAEAIPVDQPGPVLLSALECLAQSPPAELSRAPLADIWNWAIANWNIQRLRGVTSVAAG